MIARARLAASCRHIAELDEPLTEDLGAGMVRRLREAGLVERGRYRLNGSWSNLFVAEGTRLRRVEDDDVEARICRLLESGPLTRGEITTTIPESGTVDRALRQLVRDGYLFGPDNLELTETGQALAAAHLTEVSSEVVSMPDSP